MVPGAFALATRDEECSSGIVALLASKARDLGRRNMDPDVLFGLGHPEIES